MSMPTIDLPEIDFQDALSNILGSIALGEAGLAHILNTEGMKIQNVIAIDNVTIDELYAVNDSITSIVQGAANIESAMHAKLSALIAHINPPPLIPGILMAVEPNPVTQNMPFLDGPITRMMVESVTFVQGTVVPLSALGAWDASAAQDGSVIAWYVPGSGSDLYNVYIAGAGGVRGNPDSKNLFAQCINLKTIDFTHFDTVGVTNMDNMFYFDQQLHSVDVSGFDTSQVTTMSGMFQRTGLTTLNLSSFNTGSLLNMYHMFFQSQQLQMIDVRNFDVSHVTNMSGAFQLTSNLANLYLNNWVTPKDSTNKINMFAETRPNIAIYINNAFNVEFFNGTGLPPERQIIIV